MAREFIFVLGLILIQEIHTKFWKKGSENVPILPRIFFLNPRKGEIPLANPPDAEAS